MRRPERPPAPPRAADRARDLFLLEAADPIGDKSRATLITHLVAAEHRDEACISYWPDRLRVGMSGRLYGVRDTRKCLRPGEPPPDGRDPWELLAHQGRHRTWYVGGSASFESVHDLTRYDLGLLARALNA